MLSSDRNALLREETKIRQVSAYIRAHWRGEQGLAWSFWVNFVALRLLLSFAQDGLMARTTAESIGPVWAVMGLAVVLHGIIFLWQAIGLLRAAEAMVADTGQMYLMWGTQAALILAVFWALTYMLHAWYWTRADLAEARPTEAEVRAERAARYSLSVAEDGRAATLSGPIELGVTERFRALLARHPGVTEIRLESEGGNIYEARGLAALIRRNGLATIAVGDCTSACTTVFIGGLDRRLQAGARLGFHQYRIDAGYAVLNADPGEEQERDRALFRDAGVAAWFLADMHQSGAAEMWFPAPETLLEAGVLTAPRE